MGDRSFILGDRSSEITKGDRSLSVMGDRYQYNHRTGMVEMDKIVSGTRGWVTRASTQPTRKGDRAA